MQCALFFNLGYGLSFQVRVDEGGWWGADKGRGAINSVTGVDRTRQCDQVGLLVFRRIFPGICPLVPVWSLFPSVWKISALLKSNFSESRACFRIQLDKKKKTTHKRVLFALHYRITSVSSPLLPH